MSGIQETAHLCKGGAINAWMGQLLRDGQRIGLRYERDLDSPPSTLWRAITESDQLRHWLPCDIVGERREGAAITLRFWPAQIAQHEIPADQASMAGEIRVWDPPRVFEWTWDVDVLRWELRALDDGTKLTFTTWIGQSDQHDYPLQSTAAGYHVCIEQLAELVENGAVRIPLIDRSTAVLEEQYAELLSDAD